MAEEDTFTRKYSLIKPAFVELEDFHLFADRVDKHLLGSGPPGDRPDSPRDGDLFYNTDTDSIERFDGEGSRWIVPTQGFIETDPEDGSEGVQEAVEEAGGGDYVYFRPGTYDWDTTVEVPSNVTTIGDKRNVKFVVPDNHNLSRYDAPHGGYVCTAVTNSNHTGGNSNIHLGGFHVDFGGVTADDIETGTYPVGAWMHRAEDITLEDIHVDDVLPSASVSNNREYGIVYTNVDRGVLRECWATQCGYEGIGLRGAVRNCLVEDCRAWNNRIHSVQVAGWTGHDDFQRNYLPDRPHNVTIRGGQYDDDVIFHGIHNSTLRDDTDRDHDFLVEDVTGAEILVFECVRNMTIRNCEADVRFGGRDFSGREGVISDVTVDGIEHSGRHPSPVTFEAQGNRPEFRNIHLRQINANHIVPSNDSLITVQDPSGATADGFTDVNISIGDTKVRTPYLATVNGSYDGDGLDIELRDGLEFWDSSDDALNPASTLGLDLKTAPGGLSVEGFQTSQDAVDWALNSGCHHLYFPAGDHWGITVQGIPSLKITGAGKDETRFTGQVFLRSSFHTIENCGFESDCFIGQSDATDPEYGIQVTNCGVFGDYVLTFLDSARRCAASNNYGTGSAQINFRSGSVDNVAVGNTMPVTGNTTDNTEAGNIG